MKILKTKSAELVAKHLIEVVNFFEKQVQVPVKTLLTDNGKEYVNEEISKFTKATGIRHVFTSPYTPQQNGIAERRNRYLSECTRACMFDKNIDEYFWGEILLSLNYIQNRLSTKATTCSPYEKLFKRKPTANYFKPLGETVYVYNQDTSGSKLKPRFDEAILLGYDENSPQYKVWNDRTNTIQMSRNVKFPLKADDESLAKHDEVETIEITNFTKVFALKAKAVPSEDEPTFQMILQSSEKAKWEASIQAEVNNLLSNNVLEVVDDCNQRCLGIKPIFKIKRDEFGNIKSYKTRYVIQGFRQQADIDYNETYAPVANFSTFLFLLNIAASKDLLAHQVDFDAAFLNAPLKEQIFVRNLPGFKQLPEGKIYQLKKALYGLKQSPREWWLLLRDTIINFGWTQCVSDECLFYRLTQSGDYEYTLVYVDDLLLLSNNLENMNKIKQEFSSAFSMKDIGEVHQILGMGVSRDFAKKAIYLDTTAMIEKYTQDFNAYPRFNTSKLPSLQPPTMSPIEKFTTTEFLSRIGALSYLVKRTHPEYASVCGYLARRQNKFTDIDCYHLQRVFQHLYQRRHSKFTILGSSDFSISAYVDADWAGCSDDRRSVSGSVVYVGKTPVLWSSRKQDTVAMSTMEAEYYAVTECLKDVLMVKNMYQEIFGTLNVTPKLYCDNKAAIAISLSQGNKRNIRHIDLRYQLMKQTFEAKTVELEFIPSAANKADGLTKILPSNKFGQSAAFLNHFTAS